MRCLAVSGYQDVPAVLTSLDATLSPDTTNKRLFTPHISIFTIFPGIEVVSGLCGLTVERSLAIVKVAVRISAGPLPGNSLGQAAHTHVPLSPAV